MVCGVKIAMKKSECYNTEQLAEYSVGLGSKQWRQRVYGHLSVCSECRNELNAIESTAALLEGHPAQAAPDMWDSIRPQLVPQRSYFWNRVPVYAAAFAVLILAVILFWPLRTGQQDLQQSAYKYERYDSHATMLWNDPFADRASLVVYTSAGEDW